MCVCVCLAKGLVKKQECDEVFNNMVLECGGGASVFVCVCFLICGRVCVCVCACMCVYSLHALQTHRPGRVWPHMMLLLKHTGHNLTTQITIPRKLYPILSCSSLLFSGLLLNRW